jgi:ankyrin repeat protein
MLSCKLGLINIAEYLLNNGSVVNETNILGDTPLKMAQRYGHEDLVLILIQKYKALSKNINKR